MYLSTADAHDINTVCGKNRRPRWRGGLKLYRENLENMNAEKTTAGVKRTKVGRRWKSVASFRKMSFSTSSCHVSEFNQVTSSPNMITA